MDKMTVFGWDRPYKWYNKFKMFMVLDPGMVAVYPHTDGSPAFFALFGRLGISVWAYPVLCGVFGFLGGLICGTF